MAITTEEQTTILNLVVTMFDAAPGAANLEAIVGFYEASGNDIAATAAALAAGPLFTAQFADMDNAAIAEKIASNFGLEKNAFIGYDAEGQLAYDFIKAELDGGADLATILTSAAAYLATAEGAAALPTAAATLANKSAVAEYYSVTKAANANTIEELMAVIADVDATDASVTAANASIDTGYEGQTFMTTTGSDNITGTMYDDMFLSYLGQNAYVGSVSNTLSSADQLDGGAGNDTLEAQIVPEFFGATGDNQIDIQVKTNSIETATFEVRDSGSNDGQAILDDNGDLVTVNQNTLVTVDAKDMVGVSTIGSKFSDGDLKIENLTTEGVAEGLSGMTITMDHTDNGNSDEDASDLTVLFDEDYLDPTLVYGEDAIDIRIMNEDAYDSSVDSEGNAKAIGSGRLDGVYIEKMIISVHGTQIDLADYIVEDPDALGTEFTTEAELVAYLNATVFPQVAIDFPAIADIGTLVATTEGKFTSDNSRQGDIIKIAIDNPQGLTSALEVNDSWVVLGQAASVEESFASNRYERAGDYEITDSSTMEIDVTLTKVGRDGEGGNLVIGAKDQNDGHGGETDVDDTDGIPTFNITVAGDSNQPSNLGRITSTNGALKEINVVSAEGSEAALTVRGEAGSLDLDTDQTPVTPFGGTLESFNANGFVNDLYIGQMFDAHNIDTFTATGGGAVELHETVGFGGQLPSLNDNKFTATTAGGNDTMDITVMNGAQMTITTAGGNDSITSNVTGTDDSGSTESTVTISASSGDNTVVLSGTAGHDADVTTGGGMDTVTGGALDLTVDTNGGDDVIYADNTGNKAVASIVAGASAVLASANATGTYIVGNNSELLYGRTIQVTLDLPEAPATANTAGAFVTGLEVTADVVASNGYLTTELDLYTAIAKAINDDAVTNKLAKATIDSNGDLTVTYLIDGITLADDIIEVEVLNDWADLTAVEEAGILAALQDEYNDSDIAAADVEAEYDGVNAITDVIATVIEGTDSVAVNDNIVNGGLGDDVIVLSSNDDQIDTLVMDAGGFGNDTIVHFEVGAAGDILDFSAWLTNVESTSGSSVSEDRIPGTIELIATMQENSVAITTFADIADDDAGSVPVVDFDTITEAQLLAEMNAAADFGAAQNDANLVGDDLKIILMIEDANNLVAADDNEGFYKVFEVTYDEVNNEFTNAELAGTLDFGSTLGALDDTNIA